MAAGLGYFDAQGVWQFGEADTEVLMSDLLNLGMQSVTNQLILDRARLDTLEDVHYQVDGVNLTGQLTTQRGVGRTIATTGEQTVPVTFPVPFATVIDVAASMIGIRPTGAPFDQHGLIAVSIEGMAQATRPTSSGMYIHLHRTDGGSMPSYDYYYTWSATGVLA